MATVYHDDDIDIQPVLSKTVGIIGYGSQGHAQAQNLRDSGVRVLVAELEGTDNYKLAVEHGFAPRPAAAGPRSGAPARASTPVAAPGTRTGCS